MGRSAGCCGYGWVRVKSILADEIRCMVSVVKWWLGIDYIFKVKEKKGFGSKERVSSTYSSICTLSI